MPENNNHTPIDPKLILACQKSDPEAQEFFYRHYSRLVMSVCLRYAATRVDAEDIFQESFITIFEKMKNLKNPQMLISWMYKIIISKVIRFYKKKLKIEAISDRNYAPVREDPEIIQALSAEELLQHVQELPDGYRIVFNLYVMEGFSHKEISKMLGINEVTSRSQLFKAKGWLKKRIQKEARIHSYEK